MTPSLSLTGFVLLAVLNGAERRGHEIARCYADSIGESIAEGTLYVTLGRLRDDGLVRFRDDDQDNRVRWFSMTEAGSLRLAEYREFYRRIAAAGLE